MRAVSKKRKGFTLAEVIACTVILALVTIGAGAVSGQVSALKTEARNGVFLSTHNLNVMERLRQMAYEKAEGEELLTYYDEDVFSSSAITTEVYTQMATWDSFRVYSVRIESHVNGYRQKLVSTYTLTDIGGYKRIETVEGSDDNPLDG